MSQRERVSMIGKQIIPAIVTTAMASATAAWAQVPTSREGVADHGAHHDSRGEATALVRAAQPDAQLGAGMDHGAMSPPANATGSAEPRDPDAYSEGFVRGTGQYALTNVPKLTLADEQSFTSLLVDRLERFDGRDGNGLSYDAQAWFGRTYDRAVVKAEGERSGGTLEHASAELLWSHAISSYWNTQLGLRYDSGTGPGREWLAFGIQGLAPYWFEVDATFYIGKDGRTAFNFEAEYELLLTQRLILQPRIEVSAYGKADPALDIGSGLSEGAAGIRLRYEITRQFAPYVGVEWIRKFGDTADLSRNAGDRVSDTRWVAGVRLWF